MAKKYKVVFFDLGDTLVGNARNWMPNALAVINGLRARGIRLGIISNTGAMTRAAVIASLPADFNLHLFEPELVIFSSEVHLEKPNVAIFNLAVSRTGTTAKFCLFCTEDALHCLAAQHAGLRAYRVQRPPQSDLLKLLEDNDKMVNI